MKNAHRFAAVLAVVVAMRGGAESPAPFTEPVLVNTDCRSKEWMTVHTHAVPLRWDWNTNATHAALEITGMNGGYTTNFISITSNHLWQAFASSVPSAEDVYDLTLTFFGSGNDIVGAMTSRLAVVFGAFGGTAVDPVEASTTWSKVRENAVIPYDAAWTNATAGAGSSMLTIAKPDGNVQTCLFADTAGYQGWKLRGGGWGYGTFNLLLTFPGTNVQWAADLTRLMDGTMMKVQ
ncbi:MAG: hypothetical protein RBT78_06370 [Kiritimatiellia bacterium]|jgi:hypothetical protein|nr:hypothetical protein [Kiritimatiellia bacterium]